MPREPEPDERPVRPYLIGIGLVALCTSFKLAFTLLGRDVPFVLYFAPPLVAALLGGRWPGLVTALLATATANFFFLGPPLAFTFAGGPLLQCGVFLVETMAITLVCDALFRARSRLRPGPSRGKSARPRCPTAAPASSGLTRGRA